MTEENSAVVNEEVVQTPPENDPLEKLYRNVTNKRIDVGDFDNFKKSMQDRDFKKTIYDDLISAYGESVKKHIGQDFNAFNSLYGGQKKNTAFSNWWRRFKQYCANIYAAITHFPG